MIRWSFLLSVLAAARPAAAQFRLGLILSPSPALPMEPVTAVIRVENQSGAPLLFETTNANARIEFDVRDEQGDLLEPRGAVPQPDGIVAPSVMLVATVNLTRAYAFTDLQTYGVELVLVWADRRYIAKKTFLKVVGGIEMATTSVAMLDGTTRTFSLRSVSRDRYEHLILRIDDLEAGRCYGVMDLGPSVRTEKPVLRLDGSQNIHVMFQASPVQKFYGVFSANGEYVRSRDIDSTRNIISLDSKPDGNLELSVKAWEDNRLPPQLAPNPAETLKPGGKSKPRKPVQKKSTSP
jgi:hypothetical protein